MVKIEITCARLLLENTGHVAFGRGSIIFD
jgi:hypothetical protein